MPEQSYANHAQFVTGYHKALVPLLLITIIGAIYNLAQSFHDHSRLYNASLIVALSILVLILAFFARTFALKAQDRAIRAEENLRHYVLTGRLLDARLSALQIVALRFASDDEFVALAQRAANENLAPKDIKQAIRTWRADHYRV